MIDKLPPRSLEIEQACLSCGILSPEAMSKLREKVIMEDFYFDKHQVLCKCLFELFDNKISIDPVTIKEWYKKNNIEFSYQGYTEIYEASASSAGIDNYIIQLIEYSKQRQIIIASADAIQESYKSNASEIIHELTNKLRDIDQDQAGNIIPLSAVMGKDISHIQVREGEYLTTGFPQLGHHPTG